LGDYKSVTRPEIIQEDGTFSIVTINRQVDLSSCRESVQLGVDRLRDAVQSLMEAYCQAFRVAFQLEPRSEIPVGK
jgi:phosphatidylinositol-4-phosphate 3-kinase